MNKHHHRAHYKLQPQPVAPVITTSPWNISAPQPTTYSSPNTQTQDKWKTGPDAMDFVKRYAPKLIETGLAYAYPELAAAYSLFQES